MLSAPLTVTDVFVGEIFWSGCKGFFFSFAVLIIVMVFGILKPGPVLLAPIAGFFTGILFACVSLLVTSFVRDINQFNFFFTGFLSPMFFFSGVVFPINRLPKFLVPVAEFFPLTHCVRLARDFCFGRNLDVLWWDLTYIAVVSLLTGWLAIAFLRKKLVT